MKTYETLKMNGDEAGLLTTLVVLELVILPSLPLGKYGGGIAMVAVGIIGLPAYVVLFRERLRSRGQLKPFVVIAAVSIAVGAAIAAALLLVHWH
jgi:hypothetical protein